MREKKQQEKKETELPRKEKRESRGKAMAEGLFLIGVLLSGVFAAMLAAKINGVQFGWYTWPFAVCVDLFVFSSVGFFLTEGKKEVLYGACSIASVACAIVQLALLF